MSDQERTDEDRLSVWVRIFDAPEDGYTVSAQLVTTTTNEYRLGAVCVAVTPVEIDMWQWAKDHGEEYELDPKYLEDGPIVDDGITRDPPTPGITANVIRKIRMGSIRSEAMKILGRITAHAPGYEAQLAGMMGTIRPGARRLNSDQFMARLAAMYVAGVHDEVLDVYGQMADDLDYSKETMRTYIKRARKAGILTAPPAAGIAGGELTEKGARLIDQGGATR